MGSLQQHTCYFHSSACVGRDIQTPRLQRLCNLEDSGSDAAVQPPTIQGGGGSRSRLPAPIPPSPFPTAAAHTHTHSATKKNCRRLRLYRGINGVNPAIHHAVLLPESGPLARRCSSAQSPLRVCLGAITRIIQRDGLAVAGPTPRPLWSPSFVSSASKFPCMFEQNDFCHASKGRLPVVARPYCLPGSLEKLG